MENRNILSTAAQNAMPSGVRHMFELAKNMMIQSILH